MAAAFAWPVRVYWEDTDAGGIVYYANYFRFMERARTEWLRSVGIEQLPLKQEQGLIFVVVDVQAQFRKPARYGDLLQVTCEIDEASRTSLTFVQRVWRGEVDGELLIEGRARVACIDADNHRVRRLPPQLGALLPPRPADAADQGRRVPLAAKSR